MSGRRTRRPARLRRGVADESQGTELPRPDLLDEDSLLQVVEQIQAGIHREENCERLLRAYRPLVQSFFIRKGLAAEESRDLTQEVFLRVFKGIGKVRGKSQFERWLWELADNIFLNEMRKQGADTRHGGELSMGASPKNIWAEEPIPEDEFLLRQKAELAQKIHRGLPPDLQARYKVLASKRDEETLSPAEYEELLQLSDSIERFDVQRLEAVSQLAKLLGVPLRTLIEEMGLRPSSNG